MSTIVEALKKIQRAPESQLAPPAKHSEPARSVDVRKGPVLLIVFVLFSASVLGYFLYQRSRPVVHEPAAAEHPAFVLPAETISQEPESPKRTSVETFYNPLSLSGIMYLKGKPRAIINNRVLTEGDTLEGFTILKIGIDSVKVESSEGVSTVRLTR
ncbi:MAG: hypothetical protein ISS91_02450 [Candidatus Omnitrophica bacterium]|nr:hypothetical protein [Candidatus Omnitrophota bacterium]